MRASDVLKKAIEATEKFHSTTFTIESSETTTVPTLSDTQLTFASQDENRIKCKHMNTCVLYVDMRSSSEISATHRRDTLAKLYASFINAMIESANCFGGKIRGIVGDRVMVVFDSEKPASCAMNTAFLMNASCIEINKKIKHDTIKAGIGIDCGPMLVAKTGAIRRGAENEHNKELVWLGTPANTASKLTDLANKTMQVSPAKVRLKLPGWTQSRGLLGFLMSNPTMSPKEFISKLSHVFEFFPKKSTFEFDGPPAIAAEYIDAETQKLPPILFTERLMKRLESDDKVLFDTVTKYTTTTDTTITGYTGKIYGVNMIFKIES